MIIAPMECLFIPFERLKDSVPGGVGHTFFLKKKKVLMLGMSDNSLTFLTNKLTK